MPKSVDGPPEGNSDKPTGPSDARPTATPPTAKRWTTRRKALIAGGLAVAAAAVGAGVYYVSGLVARNFRPKIPPGNTGTALDQIDHVVVLMLENRSFDNVLGNLYPASAKFDGLTGQEFNLDLHGNKVPVWTDPELDPNKLVMPSPDPGEEWENMNEQLFGTKSPAKGQTPTMSGFVTNFQSQEGMASDKLDAAARQIMFTYLPTQVPALSELARSFAVSDRWFASAPCQTWPNRLFVHCGTSDGRENNEPYQSFPRETIYERFTRTIGQESWAIYAPQMSLAVVLERLWPIDPLNFLHFDDFLDDASAGTLPAYSFLEPRFFPTETQLNNDMHPPGGVAEGDKLVAQVYNALRSGPNWSKTLLIITCDEHGGCYDHVPPPTATPPDSAASYSGKPFGFDRYGVRVPAVIVSPWIRSGTVMRAPEGGPPFDHTTILSTLRKRFALGKPLAGRDAVAPDLASMPTAWLGKSDTPNNGPSSVNSDLKPPSSSTIATAHALPANDLQRALALMPPPPVKPPPTAAPSSQDTTSKGSPATSSKSVAPRVTAAVRPPAPGQVLTAGDARTMAHARLPVPVRRTVKRTPMK